MPGWASPWLWTADTWAGAQLVVLVAAAIVATCHCWMHAVFGSRRHAPFVVVDIELTSSAGCWFSNLGPTMARNVRIEIDPPLTSSVEQHELDKLKMLKEPIPSLAPQRRIDDPRAGAASRERSVPGRLRGAHQLHRDDTGHRPFTDDQVIDLGMFRDRARSDGRLSTMSQSSSSKSTRDREVATPLSDGLLVVTRPRKRQRVEALRIARPDPFPSGDDTAR